MNAPDVVAGRPAPGGPPADSSAESRGASRTSGRPGRDEQDPPLAAGAELIPGYTVIELLDRSRALEVYEVWSRERDCRCVGKTVRRSRRDDDHLVAHVLNEGRYLQSFTHPHLVRAYETIDVPTAVVILETLPGQTLDSIIDTSRRPMPVRSLAFLGLHLCSVMQYLHRHDVLHRDLKPANIVCTHGLAKVLDLSLAAAPGPIDAGCGTRGYLAPEQAGGGTATPATDVWGIGSVLYETATGQRPFAPEDRGEDYPQLTGRAASVRTRRPRRPGQLATLIDACLEPDPTDRPTVAAVAEALSRLVPDPTDVPRPATPAG
ncbi:MAG: serine/threonine protein kinase [Modestobacter sp.]|nr:serine/threonine protein kinase [Modestobacter sp.]